MSTERLGTDIKGGLVSSSGLQTYIMYILVVLTKIGFKPGPRGPFIL